ncbi:MAG: DUF2155 domain-containing protein [Caulobacter sp.]|nr:DUF2155 domain-containing protein [Caulobacter sp.]
MRLRLTLLAGLGLVVAAGPTHARQPAPQPAPAPPVIAPAAPTAEEPPPIRPAAPAPAPTPAPITAEKPAQAAAKPKVAEKPAAPRPRVRGGAAIIQAIDKVTAETLKFEAPVGQPIRYKTLIFTVRACETTAADEEQPDSAVYMTVDSQPKAAPGRAAPPPRQVFRGWMFASSPGLNPLQHPVYDAWLISCRAAAPAPAKR